jgi:hypothetical protein
MVSHFGRSSNRITPLGREDNAEAQEVLILVLTEWFNAGSLEYVELLHRLPRCILAVGRVPKNTAPLHRLVTDASAINIYA